MMEVANYRMKRQTGQDYGDWLIEESRHDPVVVHEVTSRLMEITKPVEDLSRKLSYFKSELESHLMQQKNFVKIVDDFGVKVKEMEDCAWKLRPLSAIYSKARGQHDEFRPVYREVQNVKKAYESLLERKKRVEEETDSVTPEETATLKKFPELDRRWTSVWDTVTKYHGQITGVLPAEEVFHHSVMKFAPWLHDIEKKVKQIQTRPLSRQDEFEDASIDIKVCLYIFTGSINEHR